MRNQTCKNVSTDIIVIVNMLFIQSFTLFQKLGHPGYQSENSLQRKYTSGKLEEKAQKSAAQEKL